MLTDPVFWGGMAVAVAVLFTGGRIVAHIDAMSINLGNGSNGIHAMVADRLLAIEEELHEIRSGIEGLDFVASNIEGHVRPKPEPNPYDMDALR
jgi:hypothetical protein